MKFNQPSRRSSKFRKFVLWSIIMFYTLIYLGLGAGTLYRFSDVEMMYEYKVTAPISWCGVVNSRSGDSYQSRRADRFLIYLKGHERTFAVTTPLQNYEHLKNQLNSNDTVTIFFEKGMDKKFTTVYQIEKNGTVLTSVNSHQLKMKVFGWSMLGLGILQFTIFYFYRRKKRKQEENERI